MDFPNRKQVRLAAYDYSAPGAYFVTVCTQDRRCILSHIAVGADALGGPYICDDPQRDRRLETACAPGRGADSFPAFLSRAPDPERGGLPGDLELHRHESRQMGGGSV